MLLTVFGPHNPPYLYEHIHAPPSCVLVANSTLSLVIPSHTSMSINPPLQSSIHRAPPPPQTCYHFNSTLMYLIRSPFPLLSIAHENPFAFLLYPSFLFTHSEFVPYVLPPPQHRTHRHPGFQIYPPPTTPPEPAPPDHLHHLHPMATSASMLRSTGVVSGGGGGGGGCAPPYKGSVASGGQHHQHAHLVSASQSSLDDITCNDLHQNQPPFHAPPTTTN